MVCSAFTAASGSDAIQMCRKMRAAVDLACSWKAEGFFRGRSSLWSVGVLRGYHGGDELAVQHGENQLLIFPFDTHWQTHTVCRLDGLQKVAEAPKRNLVDERFWWKETLESVSTSYTIFCFRCSNNFYNIFPYKDHFQCLAAPGLWPCFRLEIETYCTCYGRGLEMWHHCLNKVCRSMSRVNWTGFWLGLVYGHNDQDQFFLNQVPVEVLPSSSSLLRLQTHARPCNNVQHQLVTILLRPKPADAVRKQNRSDDEARNESNKHMWPWLLAAICFSSWQWRQ